MLEAVTSTIGLCISFVMAIFVTFAASREGRKNYVAATTTVIRDFQITPEPATGVNVHILGRRKGLIAWLFNLLGIENRVEMTVTERDWSFRFSSPTGFSSSYLPLKNVTATICGYQRSLAALFFCVYFSINFALTGLTALTTLLRIMTVATEALREATAQTLEKELEFMFVWALLAGIAFFFFYFSKRVQFGINAAGKNFGLLFKRSVAEGKIIDIADALQATIRLNQLHEAAVYGTALPHMPANSPKPPAERESHLWLFLIGLVCYVGLVFLIVSVHYYGNGVTLKVAPSTIGAAVYIDHGFQGTSTEGAPVVTVDHVTREKHQIQVFMNGYSPYQSDYVVSGMKTEQKIPVQLVAMKYTFHIFTNPAGARISIDGKNIGSTDQHGELRTQIEGGAHEISAEIDGYRTDTKQTKIQFDGQSAQFYLVNIEQAAKQETENRQQEVAMHLQRAQVLFRQGQYQPAMDECDQVLKLDPGNSPASSLKNQIEQTKKVLGQ